MDELISVIIPTYKRPIKLLRALNSVLSQRHRKLEILVVNDDPHDTLLFEMINELNDNRIILLKNERTKGANGARNTGIIHAKGNFIAFLDDDDEWLNDTLETQLERLKPTDNNVGLVYGGYLLEKGTKWVSNYYMREGDLFSDLITGVLSVGASSNIFIKKEIIPKVGLWDEELLRQQDLEFLVRVFKQYQVVFNNNLVAKIYGHNEPNPQKAFDEREKFLNKISPLLIHLNKGDAKLFFSNHYRRQTLFLIKMGGIKKAKQYWLKAFSYQKISLTSLRKDIKLVIEIFNNHKLII